MTDISLSADAVRDQQEEPGLKPGASAKAWPFVQARALVKRFDARGWPECATFAMGFGASGLPHIGTFGEAVRTNFVRQAFRYLTDDQIPTRLVCFSDDLDALRKVPENVPNQQMLESNLERALSAIPDPFGEETSFAGYTNARMRSFLDQHGFDYTFYSSAECYQSGKFDGDLLNVLRYHEAVCDVIRPTLGPERRATYSPFLPISRQTGRVLQVPILEIDMSAGKIVYRDPDSHELISTSVTGGACKLQWKVDWAMRWIALSVSYEMSGKDLIDSVKISSKICRILGGVPPQSFSYEMFLDVQGQKISKSRGNGVSLDDWAAYAPPPSLALLMYNKPTQARRIGLSLLPKIVDEYLKHLAVYATQNSHERLENPAWHIHQGNPPETLSPVPFSWLLNLALASNSADRKTLWKFISRYNPSLNAVSHPLLDALTGHAVCYYKDQVLPKRLRRTPTVAESHALRELKNSLQAARPDENEVALQNLVFEIGKRFGPPDMKEWFRSLYQILLGQENGPRMGSFINFFGISETIDLIEQVLNDHSSTGTVT